MNYDNGVTKSQFKERLPSCTHNYSMNYIKSVISKRVKNHNVPR